MIEDFFDPQTGDVLIRDYMIYVINTSNLTTREKDVIILRFGLEDGGEGKIKSLEVVASTFFVTRERIRQIEIKALRKMKFMIFDEMSDHLKPIFDNMGWYKLAYELYLQKKAMEITPKE